MTKTTTPKAPRLTKAQKLAQIELETQAIEAQQAKERGKEYVPPVEVNAETLEIVSGEIPVDLIVPADEVGIDLGQALANIVTTKTMKKVKTIKTGAGAQILFLIAQGELSNKEIVAKVLEDNPMRKTTYACVAWYQSQVKAGKIDLPEVTGADTMDEMEEPADVTASDEFQQAEADAQA